MAVACPDPALRDALSAHPMGRHLIVTDSLFSALTAVLATPYLMVQCLTLAPHPTAPRASSNFVTRTLLEADASRRRRDDVIDKMAAAYILQAALDRMKNLP